MRNQQAACVQVPMMTSSNGNISASLGNTAVTYGFPSKRPATRSLDVFFDPRLNKRLSTQSRRRWFETPSRSLWRHCNANSPRICISDNQIALWFCLCMPLDPIRNLQNESHEYWSATIAINNMYNSYAYELNKKRRLVKWFYRFNRKLGVAVIGGIGGCHKHQWRQFTQSWHYDDFQFSVFRSELSRSRYKVSDISACNLGWRPRVKCHLGSPNGPPMVDGWVVRLSFGWSANQ